MLLVPLEEPGRTVRAPDLTLFRVPLRMYSPLRQLMMHMFEACLRTLTFQMFIDIEARLDSIVSLIFSCHLLNFLDVVVRLFAFPL